MEIKEKRNKYKKQQIRRESTVDHDSEDRVENKQWFLVISLIKII
jgi:hypothetical protein